MRISLLNRAVSLGLGVMFTAMLAACMDRTADRDNGTQTVVATPMNAPPPPPPPPPADENTVTMAARIPRQGLYSSSPVSAAGQQEFKLQGSTSAAGALNAPSNTMADATNPQGYWQPENTSKFPQAAPNAVKVTADDPVSTFSVDVDTASYAFVRDTLNNGAMPPVDAVRVEEMVNYFDYGYAGPEDRKTPFRATTAVYPAPWNADTEILHIGIKGFELPKAERPPVNLVFLIDSSGSMDEPNKLPLLKRAFRLLVDQLSEKDRVSIVTYAGAAGVVLDPTSGADKQKILAALDKLEAGGSTAGGEGIRMAYQLAEDTRIKGGVNRVLLATDGDFNVGITDPAALEGFVVGERDKGIDLTCLGFGVDNYNDAMMQKLAQAGNGNAAFIDTLNEARKVFVQQVGGTLFTIAKDVKIQVEFNPGRIAEYRLIGYETRLLNRTDFNNDKVDAGDIGSGHTVTALYELTPVGSKAVKADPLRYGHEAHGDPKGEIAFLKIRYKLPGETTSHLIERPITDADVVADFGKLPADLRFAAAVAGSAQLMRHDPYIKDFSFARALTIAQEAKGADPFGYRGEFVQLLRTAQTASGLKPLAPEHPGR
ncbi:MAG: vWA domain-containing protein [Rhizomicrobium sp.]